MKMELNYNYKYVLDLLKAFNIIDDYTENGFGTGTLSLLMDFNINTKYNDFVSSILMFKENEIDIDKIISFVKENDIEFDIIDVVEWCKNNNIDYKPIVEILLED